MLGWTLGGYPSPNLEVVAAMAAQEALTPEAAMLQVAERRFGTKAAPFIVEAWERFSEAFGAFPYHTGVVYSAPLQTGPANLLWQEPTGYKATMVGFPYDHLEKWRAVYPTEVFIGQLERVADGFESGVARLRETTRDLGLGASERTALEREAGVAEAAALHFRSVALQARFIADRDALKKAKTGAEAAALRERLATTVRSELAAAKRLLALQLRDSRLGFEASNHYFYVPQDLLEKIVNCRHLLDHWLAGR